MRQRHATVHICRLFNCNTPILIVNMAALLLPLQLVATMLTVCITLYGRASKALVPLVVSGDRIPELTMTV